MLGKTGKDCPSYDKKYHMSKYLGINRFNEFLRQFQDISICNRCGSDGGINKKIDVHHIDEDHNNFLPSNLEPLCRPCHASFHYQLQKQPYVKIGKEFSFAGAHKLPNHKGLCKNLHGHEWKICIVIKKRVDSKTGMVMDFSDLKKIVKKHVISKLDHSYLNDTLSNPTAENLLVWIWNQLMFKGLLKGLYSIDLWESKDSVATITHKDMLSIFENENDKNI